MKSLGDMEGCGSAETRAAATSCMGLLWVVERPVQQPLGRDRGLSGPVKRARGLPSVPLERPWTHQSYLYTLTRSRNFENVGNLHWSCQAGVKHVRKWLCSRLPCLTQSIKRGACSLLWPRMAHVRHVRAGD